MIFAAGGGRGHWPSDLASEPPVAKIEITISLVPLPPFLSPSLLLFLRCALGRQRRRKIVVPALAVMGL